MKKIFWAGVVIVAVLIGWFAFRDNPKPSNNNSNQNSSNSNNSNNAQVAEETGNVLSGSLRVSTNKSRGNLMLVTDKQVIFISTSRDFSALIGKSVKVTFEGDLNNFKLLTIEPSE